MKKILIIALMGLFNTSSQCSIFDTLFGKNSYSYSSTTTTTTNGHTTTTTTTSNTQNSVTGSGKAKTTKVPLKNINKVSASGTGSLLITQCEDPNNCIENLEITADDNILEYFYGTINGDTLNLGQKNNGFLNPITPINYRLTVRDIISIQSSGDVKVQYQTYQDINHLTIKGSGSSTININNINAKKLTINSDGSSSITVNGEAESQEIKIEGSGQYNADTLKSNTAKIQLSGSAKAYLNVINIIKGIMSGSSFMDYNKKYSPIIDVKTSGSAKIR